MRTSTSNRNSIWDSLQWLGIKMLSALRPSDPTMVPLHLIFEKPSLVRRSRLSFPKSPKFAFLQGSERVELSNLSGFETIGRRVIA